MLRLGTKSLLCAFALLVGVSAHAAIIRLEANLTHASEFPTGGIPLLTCPQPGPPCADLTGVSPRPLSFGTAVFYLDTVALIMTMDAVIHNIDITPAGEAGTGPQTPGDRNDDLTVAHIHAGPAVTPTVNGPVVWGFFGTPQNDTTPNDRSVVLFGGGDVGGFFAGKWDNEEGNGTTLTAQLDNILNGRAYINFHTEQFPGGEIRGFLQIVPEPATLALMGLGLLGLAGMRRKRA